MNKPRICAVVTSAEPSLVSEVQVSSDLFELRLDLIGEGWSKMIPLLKKPWIATCRPERDGGAWKESEARRKEELLKASQMGADMIDLEMDTPNLERLVAIVKQKARLILSYHNFTRTPSEIELKTIVARQFAAGADLAKVATKSGGTQDNIRLLDLPAQFPSREIIAIAMGEEGRLNRILAPLSGSAFTYCSIKPGHESSPGQLTVQEARQIYAALRL